MRNVVTIATVMASLCLVGNVRALEWKAEFDNGLGDLPWFFFSFDLPPLFTPSAPPNHTDVTVEDGALVLLGRDADWPEGNYFTSGQVGPAAADPTQWLFPDKVQVQGTISSIDSETICCSNPQFGNSDIFLFARANQASGYVLALDMATGSFDLVRSDNGDPSNIAPGQDVENFDPQGTYILRITAEGDHITGEVFDESMNLLNFAEANDATYASGFAGLGAAVSTDVGPDEQTWVAGRFDDVFATDLAPPPVTPSADFDGDGDIDGDDFLLWQAAFGCNGGCPVDADGDDDTDGDDFLVWQAGFGTPAPAASSVPEPSALVALLIACSCLGAMRIRRATGH